jgi:hypothetical protein
MRLWEKLLHVLAFLLLGGAHAQEPFYCIDANFSCPGQSIIGDYQLAGQSDGKPYWKHTAQVMYLRWSPSMQWVFDNNLLDDGLVASIPSTTSTPDVGLSTAWVYGTICQNGVSVPSITLSYGNCVATQSVCADSPSFICPNQTYISGHYLYQGSLNNKPLWKHSNQSMFLRWAPMWTQWIFDDDFNDTTSTAYQPALPTSMAPNFVQNSGWYYGTNCGNDGDNIPAVSLSLSACSADQEPFCVVSPTFGCPNQFEIEGNYSYQGVIQGKAYWKHPSQMMYLRWAARWTQWVFDNDFVDASSVAWEPAAQNSVRPPFGAVNIWKYGSTCGNNNVVVDVEGDCPTISPTIAPTIAPTKTPTRTPTLAPTTTPTTVPTKTPSTAAPSREPTTTTPSAAPTLDQARVSAGTSLSGLISGSVLVMSLCLV